MTDREAFEARILEGMKRCLPHADTDGLFERRGDGYVLQTVDDLWFGWQSAIAYERERAAKVCDAKAEDAGKVAETSQSPVIQMMFRAKQSALHDAAAEIRKGLQ